MSTFAINPVHPRTVERARDREIPRRRRPGRASGVGLLILMGIGILAVFGVLALTASLGALGAAAAFLVTVGFVAALVALTFRLMSTSDEAQ
jgi:protein-S-isoprenylcysteine O-methyltransferase Ste14